MNRHSHDKSGTNLAPKPAALRGLILLVDDDADLRELVKMILESYGYRVAEAGSSREALEVWKMHEEQIALLITDIVMAGEGSGVELAEKLRAVNPRLPIIFSSGHGREAADLIPESLNPVTFLPKPYKPAELASAVLQCMGT